MATLFPDDHDPNRASRAEVPAAPERNKRFAHPAIEPIFAAFKILPLAAQHEFYEYVAELLAGCIDPETDRERRQAAAIRALRDTARELGHSPSVPEYRTVREAHPERGLPADGSIRAWLGGRWNDALRATGLDTVATATRWSPVAVRSSRRSELMRAIDAFVGRLGKEDQQAVLAGALPAMANDYVHWAHTSGAEVPAPLSALPFERSFGNFDGAVDAWREWKASGELPTEADRRRSGRADVYWPEAGTYGRAEVRRALVEVAERLRASPGPVAYMNERERI